ncbi:MAG TPA: zinc ribbon domain-containing protein [Burkholderiales bacterium]|nr:zinc ribbon domain-containing protein [Burkholderiales bacterium]
MPIYEYRCAACGHQEDHLQKLSEAPLTKCPACGKKKYQKQLTAAGFQLKGSGWYASDFKGGGKKPDEAKPETKAETKAESKSTEAKSEAKTEAKPEKKKPATTAN